MPDLTAWLHQLAETDEDGEDRVYSWRNILNKAYEQGFQDGYHAAGSDEFIRARLREAAKPKTQEG